PTSRAFIATTVMARTQHLIFMCLMPAPGRSGSSGSTGTARLPLSQAAAACLSAARHKGWPPSSLGPALVHYLSALTPAARHLARPAALTRAPGPAPDSLATADAMPRKRRV